MGRPRVAPPASTGSASARPWTSRSPAPRRPRRARPAPIPARRTARPRPPPGPRTTPRRLPLPATARARRASAVPRGPGSPAPWHPRPRGAPPLAPPRARARPGSARRRSPTSPGELKGDPGVRRATLDDAEQPALHVLLEVRGRPVRLERLLVVVLLVEEETARLLPAPVHLVHPAPRFLESGLGQLGEEVDRLVLAIGQDDVGDCQADHRSAPLRNSTREANR